jgi:hypothetical protein
MVCKCPLVEMAENVTYKFAMDSEHRLYRDGTILSSIQRVYGPPL